MLPWAAARKDGSASEMATFSAWILPSARIEPLTSRIQTKCSCRRAIGPPSVRNVGTSSAMSSTSARGQTNQNTSGWVRTMSAN